MRLGRSSFKKFSGGDTPLPGGGDPLRTFPQHRLRPRAGVQAPRMLKPPRINNPPRNGYGPEAHAAMPR